MLSPKSQEENVQRRKTTGLNSARNSVKIRAKKSMLDVAIKEVISDLQ